MDASREIAVLNRLLAVVTSSLPVYLDRMQPWARRGTQQGRDLLMEIAADHRQLAHRLRRAISLRRGQPEPGRFPIEFTGLNDTAVEHLVQTALSRGRTEMAVVNDCVAASGDSAVARLLAETVAAQTRRHLAKLEELVDEEAEIGQENGMGR